MNMRVVIDQNAVMRATRSGEYRAIQKCLFDVEREAKILLSVGGGTSHLPSMPGTPPHTQRGQLRSSVHTAMILRGDQVVGICGPTEKYGKMHEFALSTRPHEIIPRRREYLHFFVGGEEIFTKHVNHPGSHFPFRRFMAPALHNTQSGFARHFAGML